MTAKTIRDIEFEANVNAGVEAPGGPLRASVVLDPSEQQLTYVSIAEALAHRYDSIYYVNLENDHYVEYTSSNEYQDLHVEISGTDFFADCARNIRRVVHPDDQAFALMVHQKDYILAELESENLLSFTYRIMFDGVPHYYNGRITSGGSRDRTHLIIGWTNVDSEVKRENDFEIAQHEQRITKDINKALTSDYVKVFYVNLDDGHYVTYIPNDSDGELTANASGNDFFADIQSFARQSIYHLDIERFSVALREENILRLMEDAPFIITYRVLEDGSPIWHTMKALYSANGEHMLLAVRNIDIQKRREADYEYRLHSMALQVNRDAMTSVKNMNAFMQEEAKWNQILADNGNAAKFAVAVCNVNDTTIINETKGQRAGDQTIIDAAQLVSSTFKHSPVFRIGGDEFAVVLTGRDYFSRSSLMGKLEDQVRHNIELGLVSIASGVSAYGGRAGETFSDVFERARTSMRANKARMKEGLEV